MSIEKEARAEAEREYPLPEDLSTTSRIHRIFAREHYANGYIAGASRQPSEGMMLSESQVWAIAKVEHDYYGDSNNVDAFVIALVESLQVAGVAFDEQPFIDAGFLTPPARTARGEQHG